MVKTDKLAEICDANKCTACMACKNVCSQNAIHFIDNMSKVYAVMNNEKCIGCGACQKVCPVINPVVLKQPIIWKQGWGEDEIRKKSSSGGVASALMKSFMQLGGYVASCAFINGEFSYILSNDVSCISKFAGSKYVKSMPKSIYKDIKTVLKDGYRVLFIGLPCHVAGIKRVFGDEENLYTVDLICHGSPSPKLLKKYLGEKKSYGIPLKM